VGAVHARGSCEVSVGWLRVLPQRHSQATQVCRSSRANTTTQQNKEGPSNKRLLQLYGWQDTNEVYDKLHDPGAGYWEGAHHPRAW
jgi:hypothetical protein